MAERIGDALGILTTGPRDAAERHRTLRGTIEWSHSHLGEAEKILFRRMGVFASTASLESIEQVCGGDALSVLDALDHLADLSLVQPEAGRFSMLKTIAQFARERLEEAPEAEDIKRRHANAMVTASSAICSGIEGGDQVGALRRGIEEEPDISLALDRCLNRACSGDARMGEKGPSIVANLWMYWHIRGMHVTAREYAEALLEATASAPPSAGRAGTLLSLGLAQWTLGHVDEANELWSEAYDMASGLGDLRLQSRAAFSLAAGFLGLDPGNARSWAKRGAAIGQDSGDRWAFAFARGFDAFAEAILGNLDAARGGFGEALAVQTEIGDFEGSGFALGGLAFIEVQTGNLQSGTELYERARAAYATIGDRAEEARLLGKVAWAYLASGDIVAARRRFLDSITAYQDVASRRGVGLALVGLVATDTIDGVYERAVLLAGVAERLVGEEGIANVYQTAPQGTGHRDAAMAALAPEVAARAHIEGRNMTLEEAVSLARS